MIKRFLKRAVSTLLCTTMIISSGLSNIAYAGGNGVTKASTAGINATVSRAGDINANITGGTFNMPAMTASDTKHIAQETASLWNNSNNCGYRITVVDRQGKAVSNSLDILVYDVFYVLKNINYVDAAHIGEYADAFDGGDTGAVDTTGRAGSTKVNNESGVAGNVTGFLKSLYNKDKNGNRYGIDLKWSDGGIRNVAKEALFITGHKFDDTQLNYGELFEYVKGKYGIDNYNPKGGAYCKGIIGANTKVTTFNKLINYIKGSDQVDDSIKSQAISLLPSVIPSQSGSGYAFYKLLTLGAESGHKGEMAALLLNWKDDEVGYMLDYTDASLKKQVSDKKSTLEVARDNKLKVVVEPIVWCVPFIGSIYNDRLFTNKSKKTQEFCADMGNNIYGYIEPCLVYGSVTQVAMNVVGSMYQDNQSGFKYKDPKELKLVDNMMVVGTSDLIQTCFCTVVTSKDDPEITYNGMPLYSPAQHPEAFAMFDGGSNRLTVRGLLTGDFAGTSMDFWRIVGYGCGVLDINELFRPSTGTSTPGTPAGPTDPTKYSKLVKIYLDKDGDGYKQSGYYEEDKWYNETVSVVDEMFFASLFCTYGLDEYHKKHVILRPMLWEFR